MDMATTLGSLCRGVLRRLGDEDEKVWTSAEVQLHVVTGYRRLAFLVRIFWDQLYLENVPPGFSVTQSWETAYSTFSYGIANYTYDDERRLADWDGMLGPANHTCPDELAFLSAIGASTAIAATVDVPASVTEIERATWDGMTLVATTPQRAQRLDSRYQITTGEVYAYTFRQDGMRTFRKIRVPSASADTFTAEGAWGLLRDPADITDTTPTGTWGIVRRLPATFGMHWDTPWGAPRRAYRTGKNVCVEHWREGRPMVLPTDTCELPDHYARYLKDYAQARCLGRSGPGQDLPLSAHYDLRWTRGLERIQRRASLARPHRVGVLGDRPSTAGHPPPRPKLPWNYPQRVRP